MSQHSKKELTSAIAADYEATHKPTLQTLSKKYNLHPLTVHKHLVTAGVYDTSKTNLVLSALSAVLEQSIPYDQIVVEVEKHLAERNVVMSTQTIYSYLFYDITASQTDQPSKNSCLLLCLLITQSMRICISDFSNAFTDGSLSTRIPYWYIANVDG